MKKSLLILGLLCAPLAARAQVSNPSIIPVPSAPSSCGTLPLKVVQNTNQVYGTNGSGGCSQIGGGGGGSSVTLENVYAAPGSFTFPHNLGSLFYQVHCVTRAGAGYAPATYSDTPVDTNNATITVPAAGDYICSFSAVATLQPNFNIAATPTSQTYWPTMTGTQSPTFTINQTAVAGYTGTATYTSSGLASGMTGAYSPTTITGTGSSTLTLSFPANQAAATTSFTVQGSDGTITHTVSPSITVGNINSGLVECWAMTDGSGSSIADSCGTSNTEPLTTGTFTWASNAGLPGTTPTFSATAYTTGANQTATNFDGTAPFSVSAWVKLPGTAASQVTAVSTLDVSSSFKGWEMSAVPISGSNYHLSFYLINTFPGNSVNVETVSNLVGGSLHYIVDTYDGSRTAAGVHLYIDGVDAGETIDHDTLSATAANTKPVSLGGRPGGTDPINGLMAYARIYSRALSAADVANYYAAGAR